MLIARLLLVLPLLTLACGDGGTSAEPDAGNLREIRQPLMVGEDGRSDELRFSVPSGTRSMTVVVQGGLASLYGLAELRLAGGGDLVGLPAGHPGPAMRSLYDEEQIGHMPGDLDQSTRLGTFTLVYPYRPDQELSAGEISLRVAGEAAGPVDVTVLLPEDDSSAALHVELVVVSDTIELAEPPVFLDDVQEILGQAGLGVVFDGTRTLTGTDLEAITDFSEPQETPTSMSAMLPALVADGASSALPVFIVEALPPGVGGLSLGTPGPPLRDSYFHGVVLRHFADPAEMARVMAHEVCHFLALQHVTNRGISGAIYDDPLDDTRPGEGNLMEDGTILTADQSFALRRSALLQPN